MLAEARNLLQAYARKCVNIHFENLNDMVLEAAKSSEILTEKMRNLVLQMTLDKRKYEQYQSDLVLIHGIEIAYEENILSISLPALIPHRKQSIQITFINRCIQLFNTGVSNGQNRIKRYRNTEHVPSAFLIFMIVTARYIGYEIMTILKRSMC